MEWLDVEYKEVENISRFTRKREGAAKQQGWPEAAMDRRTDSLQSGFPLTTRSVVLADEVVVV